MTAPTNRYGLTITFLLGGTYAGERERGRERKEGGDREIEERGRGERGRQIN